MKIIWDERKNLVNQAKHGVSFEDASALFSVGVDYLELFDQAHSDDEDRFIAIGPIGRGVVLVVFTEQEEETIRIIGARLATRRERAHYERFMEQQR